jgi:spore germination cell wall hydrolase CwlJ-like protein
MQGKARISRSDRALFTALAITLATAGAAFGAAVGAQAATAPSVYDMDALVHAGERALPNGNAFAQLAAEHRCLSEAIYYEARGEGERGQQAVAEVVMHRLADGGYGKSICQVIYEGSSREDGCQFSFTCNGDLERPREAMAWMRAQDLAAKILTQEIKLANTTNGATSYHATWVSPYWAPTLKKTTQIGNHIFYRAPSAQS